MKFKGKVALITGGASGIGAQTAKDFAKEGAKVVILDIKDNEGKFIEKEINDNDGEALFIKCDVSKKSDVESAVNIAFEKYKDIDFLVNSAAILIDGMIHKISENEWDAVINVNLKGTFLCIQAVSKYWINSAKANKKEKITSYPDKRIINISSMAANGNVGQIVYSSSKAGIIGMTNTCAKELLKYNIRTHVVMPTLIDTPMIKDLLDKENSKWRCFYENRIPFGIGKPFHVSGVILFLCSNDAYFMNGAILEINGGRLKFL
ncbi:3-oxoacyl-(acyl-carrier-protein) reductase FabG [groundwater metagenome]|uniref:3-oxoacyl-(Acyl-carrier-protein) reductase FabG n=1 Tax=groundwater metagenome TaxID=717931 RepID=A0A098EA89_9ZZZZ